MKLGKAIKTLQRRLAFLKDRIERFGESDSARSHDKAEVAAIYAPYSKP